MFNGTYETLTDPDYAQYIQANLPQAVTLAHSRGGAVILNTSPYFDDGTPNSLVDSFNQIVRNVVSAEYPSFVTVFDVNALLDPGGTYSAVVDGVLVRTPDGVHITERRARVGDRPPDEPDHRQPGGRRLRRRRLNRRPEFRSGLPAQQRTDSMTAIAIAHRGEPLGTVRTHSPPSRRRWRSERTGSRSTCGGPATAPSSCCTTRHWNACGARPVSVGEVDVAEVQALGEPGGGIPTLAEVLEAVPVPLMVDFTRREVVAGGLEAVQAAGALSRCLFVTGNVEALRQLRAASAEARLGLTWLDGPDPPLDLLRELGAEYWNPWFGLLRPAGVAAVHDAGRLVSTWTVDTSEDMAAVGALGVDAIVSNRIADLLSHLGR